ncbi:hypothetical protein Tco_1442725 [Tanacetum coccineum]
MDQSGGATLGCRGLTGAGTGGQCDHISSELVHPTAPSKRQSLPSAHLADPSSVLGGPANHLGSCDGGGGSQFDTLTISLVLGEPIRNVTNNPFPKDAIKKE